MSVARFRHAARGVGLLLRRPEGALHAFVAMVVVVLGFYWCLDRVGWVLVAFAVGSVLSAEAVNTALEDLADAVTTRRNVRIRRAKDLAAAAVLVSSAGAAIIGIITFLPPLMAGTVGSCVP